MSNQTLQKAERAIHPDKNREPVTKEQNIFADSKQTSTMPSRSRAAQKTHLLPKNAKEIFKSGLLWRIIMAVSLVIILIQAATIALNISVIKNQELKNLSSIANSALATLTNNSENTQQDNHAASMIKNSDIEAITLYEISTDDNKQTRYAPIATYGHSALLSPIAFSNQNKTWIATDKNKHETWVTPKTDTPKTSSLGAIISMNTSSVQAAVKSYIINAALSGIILTLIVAMTLLMTIGYWLLAPILFMKSNLAEASKNPDSPKIPLSPFNPEDEIGKAIVTAQDLIRQNSFNLQKTKSSAETKIYKLAYFDALTTLPNRAFFLQQIERAIKPVADRPQQHFYIIAVDLDNFKDINDSMGHNVGDSILRNVGKRLKAALPASSIVSRTGEDEFAVMLNVPADSASKESVASEVVDIIRKEPFKVFNESLQVRASAGISAFPQDGTDAAKLVKNADIALNKAKEDGRDTVKEYSEDFERAIQERFTLLRDLRKALDNNELELFYQPQLDLKSGRIIGAEALIRWFKTDPENPEEKIFISPGEFIPAAEQSGLIVPMGEWIMRQACKDARDWNEKYGFDMRVAINISAAQFSESDITALTKQMLSEYNLSPDKVELEVTESVFMDDINQTIQTLKNLNSLGVELAIDDFGTGYSSLSYLRQFPIDRLKIDQAFIRNALNNPDDASITKTIIALGRSLNLKVIAEGVETREHEDFLISEGCDEVQGFRYSKPVPNHRFIEFCKEYNGDLRSFSQI